jgi:hypothetical protein
MGAAMSAITLGDLTAALTHDEARDLVRELLGEIKAGTISPAIAVITIDADQPTADQAPDDDDALGSEHLPSYGMRPHKIKLYSTRAAWEAAGKTGTVIINWHYCLPYLADAQKIICDSMKLAERVERQLKAYRHRLIPNIPRIGIAASDKSKKSAAE